MARNSAPPPPLPTVERAKNFLAYGFAISIVLHLIAGPFLKFERTQTTEDQPQKVTVVRVPTPPPTPATCARPNVPATTLRAVEPDTPQIAQQQGISGTVQVIVSLDSSSHVTGTRIQTSPSAVLNSAALSAARQSTFQTEIRDC